MTNLTLRCGIYTVSWTFVVIRGQSVTQGSMGCNILLSSVLEIQDYNKVKLPGRNLSLVDKALK